MEALDSSDLQGRIGPRRVVRGQRGQMLVMFLIFLIPMTLAVLSVYNVGMFVSEKIKLQNAADNAAYSAATWEARYANLSAYTTRAMVANYDTIAFVTGIWSFADGLDGFIAGVQQIVALLCLIPLIDVIACPVQVGVEILHEVMHQMNNVIAQGVKPIGIWLELYNDALSVLQEALLVTTQLSRPGLIRKIAAGVDGNIQYWPGAELFNFQELNDRFKWEETDPQNGLRLTTENSLDELSNGGAFRDFDNLIPGLSLFKKIINVVTFGCGAFNVGPEGFDGPGFDHASGKENPTSGEYATGPSRALPSAGSGNQRIVRGGNNASLKDTLYQLDHSGIELRIGGCGVCPLCIPTLFDLSLGHFSDDQYNSGANVLHGWDSIIPHGSPISNTAPEPVAFDEFHPQNVQDIDGTDRIETSTGTSPLGDPGCIDALTDPPGFIQFVNDCRTEYKLRKKLKDVDITIYKDDTASRPNGERIEGPRIFVYLTKPSTSLPLFQGMGLTEGLLSDGFTPSIDAYAMARVYFTQRPAGKKTFPTGMSLAVRRKIYNETGLNPFWAGRLERVSGKRKTSDEMLH